MSVPAVLSAPLIVPNPEPYRQKQDKTLANKLTSKLYV